MKNATVLVACWFVVAVCCRSFADETANGLVGHWDFDEGAGHIHILHDRSGNGNDGTIYGATWVPTEAGAALKFDGTGDYVDFTDNPNLKIRGDMTLAAWVKLLADPYPNPETNWYIFNCEQYQHSGFALRVGGATGLLYYRSSQAEASQHLMSKTKIHNGVFCHVVLVRKGNTVTWFIDAHYDAQSSTKGPASGDVPFTISQKSQSFQGLIDDVRIYRRALPASEIVGLYKQGAESRGKDTSWFGKFQVRPYLYFAEGKAIVEVKFNGILPLAQGDEVAVELGQPDQPPLAVRTVTAIPESGEGEFEFALVNLSEGNYEIRVILRNRGAIKALKRIPFHHPPLPGTVPSPKEKIVPPLPPASELVRYRVDVGEGGGFRVRFKGESYLVESRYSYPYGGENRLSATDAVDTNGEPGWNVTDERVDAATYHVTASGDYYVINREIKLEPTRVLVRDNIVNVSSADLGIILTNDINVADKKGIKRYPIPPSVPMVFLYGKDHGLGMVALDDVYRVQQIKHRGDASYGIGSYNFGLAEGASYALEWAIYPCSTSDYYDLVNTVRKDEGLANRTIDGCYSISHSGRWLRETPPPDLVEFGGLKYVSSGCLTNIADDPGISLDGFDFIECPEECEALKNNYIETKKLFPDLKVMFHVAPHLRTTNQPDGMYEDSRMLDPSGRHSMYGNPENYFSAERRARGWAFYPYYPTLDNTFGQAMIDSVDVMMDEIGTDGVFADGLLSGYGAQGTYQGFTYDRWDGHCVEIDTGTKTISKKMGSVFLLARDVVIAYVRKINAKGGRVIVNEMGLTPRSFCRENTWFNAETNDGDHRCAQIYLAPTIIGLADPEKSANERDVYNDIRGKLAWGALYAYYYWSCRYTHRMITAVMYPITVEEIHPGYIKGKERLITMNSGVYGWPGDSDLHFAHLADGRGVLVPPNFLTTVDDSGVRTEITLKKKETAVLKPIPVSIKSPNPVNVVSEKYDAEAMHITLNGTREIIVTIRDGEFRIKPNTAYMVVADDVSSTVKSDGNARLSFPIQLDGQLHLAVADVR